MIAHADNNTINGRAIETVKEFTHLVVTFDDDDYAAVKPNILQAKVKWASMRVDSKTMATFYRTVVLADWYVLLYGSAVVGAGPKT